MVNNGKIFLLAPLSVGIIGCSSDLEKELPNVVLIYADDLGYGDLGCYGADYISTPAIDSLASTGVRFLDAHSPSATSTPSRYSLMTGRYAWRTPGTDVIQGDAPLLIDTSEFTLPKVFKSKGYNTAVVGKWHLGLGLTEAAQDWNGRICPGPNEIGFDYSFIIPATGDRVPCVFVEQGRVVNLDESDSIIVDYSAPIPGELLAEEHPELLEQMWSHGHNQALINGIGRIGYMSGGKNALWKDDEIAETLVAKAKDFICGNYETPFFLYLATHDIHVPRVPSSRFENKSGYGKRGDVILQLDWTVGEIVRCLDSLGIRDNTIIIFSSDNGPVLDDGYEDNAEKFFADCSISGPYRGIKGSSWEGGTRVPAIVNYPHGAMGLVSGARVSHVDLIASFAEMLDVDIPCNSAPDSYPMIEQWLGKSQVSRPHVVEHNNRGILSYLEGDWKYIEAFTGNDTTVCSNRYGTLPEEMLFNLEKDIAETDNLARKCPEKCNEMREALLKIKNGKSLRSISY